MNTVIVPQTPSLNDLVGLCVRALIRRFHLNRDWIIGLVGERGSGKSLGGSNIAIKDFAMNNEPVFSNMQIKLQVDVGDDFAAPHGIPGGSVVYETQHIDKQSFLALDGRYEGGCLFFDEFNLEYGEARRSTANVNLMTDRAVQQLRKLQCGLIYTVINEMYVDNRIRDNTDVFIRCSDVALNAGNLGSRMTQGTVFEWMLYPMTARLVGNDQMWDKVHKAIGPIRMTLGHLWGSIDTLERQAAGMTKYTDTKQLLPMEIKESPGVRQAINQWKWLEDAMDRFWRNHEADGDVIEINSDDFREELGVNRDRWPMASAKLYSLIPDMERKGRGKRYGRYLIPNKVLQVV